MNSDLFVEDSLFLTPKDILCGILSNQNKKSDSRTLDYWLDDLNNPSVAFVSISGNEPQSIGLEWKTITFGERAYFLCECESRVSKLYLPRGSFRFKCRKCHSLQYQLTSFSRYSVAGKSLYHMNRLQKLTDSRAGMGRIFYNGNYTKKFERFLGLCDKAGLENVVQGAKVLKELVSP
jgi:hypothetical protein